MSNPNPYPNSPKTQQQNAPTRTKCKCPPHNNSSRTNDIDTMSKLPTAGGIDHLRICIKAQGNSL